MIRLLACALLLPLLSSLPAAADDDGACRRGPITAERAVQIARSVGLARVEEVECDDGKWEIEGRHADGREMEVDVSARDGRILDIDYD